MNLGPQPLMTKTVLSWSEKELQQHILKTAKLLGWLAYHTYDSRRSEPGFPDLVLVHTRRPQVMYRELKTTKGKHTPDQAKWLAALALAGVDAGTWRPSDWANGRILRELQGA